MKSDEGFLNNVDKQMFIQLVNENVIILTQNKIQKGQFLLPFFLSVLKFFNELFNELLLELLFGIVFKQM